MVRINRPALRRAGGDVIGLAWAPFRLLSGGLHHVSASIEPYDCLTTISTKDRGGGLSYQERFSEVAAHLHDVTFPSSAR